MTRSTNEAIVSTLTKLAAEDLGPKKLYARAREAHPTASKNEIVRAAFRALIDSAEKDHAKADRLHALAMEQRADIVPD